MIERKDKNMMQLDQEKINKDNKNKNKQKLKNRNNKYNQNLFSV
jgi:hypothetical protein